MPLSKIKSTGIDDNSVTSAKILDGTIVNADVNACAAIASSKLSGAVTSAEANVLEQNIALLGFKMAVNDGLTVFNLVDGVVDEFHDESGTDEGEGSNDTYCSSNDNYINLSSPVPGSAGFSTTAITEPQTSTTGTNPTQGSGTSGTFTVPTGVTSVDMQVWGAAGAGNTSNPLDGGGGGYAEGTLAVTASQTLKVLAGEGGENYPSSVVAPFLNGGGGPGNAAGGGGLAGVFATDLVPLSAPQYSAPQVYIIAGSGGAAGGGSPSPEGGGHGGGGGGLIGNHGNGQGEQTNRYSIGADAGFGGGGSQTAGGQAGLDPEHGSGVDGGFLKGGGPTPGGNSIAGGGAGFYGGGTGDDSDGATSYAAGGGSSYYGHPQITSGSTEDGGANDGGDSGGLTQPGYVADTGEGSGPNVDGEDGFTLLTYSAPGSTTSTTIVSNAFTASSAPTTSRIVVFQETASGSPTLNTDIIASISRDGGSNFTTATLSDSGYVTGSSGQRILTGVATISGQPSGTSMRWKLALANNQSKIHGVSLQWK
jgi:hypothetical protein